jgi:hypothetical protein
MNPGKHSRLFMVLGAGAAALIGSAGAGAQAPSAAKTIGEADCTAAKLGDSIPVASIGEPVSAVTLTRRDGIRRRRICRPIAA